MKTEIILRVIASIVAAIGTWYLAQAVTPSDEKAFRLFILLTWPTVAWALALVGTPYLTTRPYQRARHRLYQIPAQELVTGTGGLLVGLIVSALLAIPLSLLPSPFGQMLPFVTMLAVTYLGVTVTVVRRNDIVSFFRALWAGREAGLSTKPERVLVDTSAIIDGRIADISQTGFIRGIMVIPRFVLDELQHIADSPDVLRRNRGRRGLDMLRKLQKEAVVPIQIAEVEIDVANGVDGRLVRLAMEWQCPIITNDFNLNRVAAIQGVRVLNVNELANAVKTVVLPGEEMSVHVIQEGKELGQGVGYLDDGTMVVVENGRKFINRDIETVVTRVFQTAAGRMIFAHPKGE